MAPSALLLLPGLALLLLGAHFLRAGLLPLAGFCAAMVALLFVRAPWASRTVRLMLALGTLEWLRTAWLFGTARAAAGQPFGRLLVILGAVAALSGLAAWLVGGRWLKHHFRAGQAGSP